MYFSDRFKVESQKGDCNMTDLNAFPIKNDMLLSSHSGKKQLIVDTKYKIRPKDQRDKKGGVSQTDLYQMISYALRRNTNQVLLIYPNKYGQERADKACHTISSLLLNTNQIRCKAVSVDITGPDHKTMILNVISQLSDAYSILNNQI